jgi:small basic protein
MLKLQRDDIRALLPAYVHMIVQDVKRFKGDIYSLNYVDEMKLAFYVCNDDMKNYVRESLEKYFPDRVFVSEYDRHNIVMIVDGEIMKFDSQMVIFK